MFDDFVACDLCGFPVDVEASFIIHVAKKAEPDKEIGGYVICGPCTRQLGNTQLEAREDDIFIGYSWGPKYDGLLPDREA